MRAFLLLSICAILGGCTPSPSTVVSFAVGSVSYFFTGKTTTDHGISLVMQEDCELARVIEGEICADEEDYDNATMVAALQPLPEGANFGDTRVEIVELPTRAFMATRRDEALETTHPALAPFKVNPPPRTEVPAATAEADGPPPVTGAPWAGQISSAEGRQAIMR